MAGLTFTSSDYRFDTVAPGSPGTGNDLIQVNGATTINGGTLTPGTMGAAGNYTILASTGTINYIANPTINTPTGTPTSFTPHFNANSITVDVLGGPISVFWTGAVNDGGGNFQWDVNATQNWTNGATADKFFNLDTATFDNAHVTGSRIVTLNAAVSPTAVVVNNSTGDYTITGTGSIGGTATLTKSGSSALTLGTVNTYTGPTILNAGTLRIAADNNLGTAPTGATIQHSRSPAARWSPQRRSLWRVVQSETSPISLCRIRRWRMFAR